MAVLYDYLGRPIRKHKLKEELAGPTVTGVRSPLSGHPAQGLTPERLARLMREAEQGDPTRYLELAEEMEEKETHYRSVLGTRKLQVSGLDIQVESVSDAAEDVADADFIRDFLSTEVLQGALFDVLDAVGKGYSACEIMWECTEKTWLPRAIEWRDPRWFTFDFYDGTTPLLRGDNGQQLPLEPAKFIFHRHKSKSGLPVRGGLARAAAWGYLFKNFDMKAWVIFAEVYGHPLRLGKYDAGATAEDKATLLRAVRDIGMDHAAIVPEGMAIEFIDAKASGNVLVYEKLADYIDRQLSKLVLGQTGTTDTGSRVGTANAHERVRDDIEASDAKQLATTLNRDLVRPLILFNRGERQRFPRITIQRPDQEDIDSLVDNVVKLVPLGLKVEASVLRDKLGLPDPDEAAELLAAPTSGWEEIALARSGAVKAGPPGAQAEKDAGAQHSRNMTLDTIGNVSADLATDWRPLVLPMTDPILALAEGCDTAEEFMERLPGLVKAQNTQAMALQLARALFAAKLTGMAEGFDQGGS